MLSEYTYYSYEDQCCKSKIFDLDPNLPQFESGYGSEPFHYVKNVSVLIKTVKFAFEEKYASKIFKITFYKLHIKKVPDYEGDFCQSNLTGWLNFAYPDPFGIRTRIHKLAGDGSNLYPDPQQWLQVITKIFDA